MRRPAEMSNDPWQEMNLVEQPPSIEPDVPSEAIERSAEPQVQETLDVFLSYSSKDAGRVRFIVEALEHNGFSVWWDLKLRAGSYFSRVIRKKLDAAKCVVVVWSLNSVESNWVEVEAAYANQRGILVPVMIEEVGNKVPLEFSRIEAAKLIRSGGDVPREEMESFLASVADLVGSRKQSVSETPHESGETHTQAPWYVRHRLPLLVSSSVIMLALVIGLVVFFVDRSVISSDRNDAVVNFNHNNVGVTQNPDANATPSGSPFASSKGQALGIDLSKFNRLVEWDKVNKGYVSFVMLKATEGTNKVDDSFSSNWTGAKSAGILRGAYHFFRPDQSASEQANNFLGHVRLEPGDLPPCSM